MSFGQPLWFWGFAFLPLLIVLYARNESRRSKLLQQLVAARLLGRLAGTVSLRLRRLRFALFLLGLAALLVSLAQPRYGYTWEQSKRQGRDILIAIDCSRSMLATDLAPSRLGRAKLATQDLISQLQGDRVGLIAFAGTAFLQAPLTIDYGAVLDSLNELDTNIIPRGGTNIAAAITEADAAFGKGESDNRCLIIMTDGEELESDAVTAAAAQKDHMRIFTVGLGSADGSIIPVPGENGGTEFVKDENGQIVKSRLDEDRLRKIAESTGGFYVHLQSGPAEMKQIIQDGLGKMKEKDIDARMSRRPIERYQWPLSASLVLLVMSAILGERKWSTRRVTAPMAVRAVALLLLLPLVAQAKNSGLEAYEREDYKGAITEFDRQLQQRKDSAALNFDLGAAAYKSGDYAKALDAFSKAVTSPDPKLRAAAEYNLGNTLFEQGRAIEQKENRVRAWKDALQHYDQALKVTPGNKDAEYNRDVVRKLLEEQQQQKSEQQKQQQQDKKDDQKKDQKDQQNQQQQQSKGEQNKDQKDQQQQQQKSGGSQDQDKNQQQNSQQQQSQSQQQQQSQNQQSQGSSGQQQQQQQQNQQGNAQQDKDKDQSGKDGQQNQPPQQQQDGGKGDEKKDSQSNPSQGDQQSPQQKKDGKGEQPQLAPDESGKKREGDIQAQGNPQQGEKADPQQEAAAEAQAAEEGKMTPAQAKSLLESLKGEDERVQLNKPTGKPHGRNFRDW